MLVLQVSRVFFSYSYIILQKFISYTLWCSSESPDFSLKGFAFPVTLLSQVHPSPRIWSIWAGWVSGEMARLSALLMSSCTLLRKGILFVGHGLAVYLLGESNLLFCVFIVWFFFKLCWFIMMDFNSPLQGCGCNGDSCHGYEGQRHVHRTAAELYRCQLQNWGNPLRWIL